MSCFGFQLERYTHDEAILAEFQEGRQWEKFKTDTMQAALSAHAKRPNMQRKLLESMPARQAAVQVQSMKIVSVFRAEAILFLPALSQCTGIVYALSDESVRTWQYHHGYSGVVCHRAISLSTHALCCNGWCAIPLDRGLKNNGNSSCKQTPSYR